MGELIRRRDRLGVRLAAAFTATALGAVAVTVALAWAGTGSRIDQARTEERTRVVGEVIAALEVAHVAAGGWEGADLLPAHTLAAAAGAVLTVATADGAVLPVPPDVEEVARRIQHRDDEDVPTHVPTPAPGVEGPSPRESSTGDGEPPQHGDPEQPAEPRRDGEPRKGGEGGRADGAVRAAAAAAPVTPEAPPVIEEERSGDLVVGGQVVGRATLMFTRLERVDPMDALVDTLARNLLLAGAVAAALGVLAALLVAPQLTRPLRRLTAVVDRVARGGPGDRSARSDLSGGVGELGVLARSVARMAADLEREDHLRRAVVADVAHEVRTPLTVLLGEVEALEDGVAPADPEHLASLHEEVLRLARLVEDLDAIAAAEAAGLDLQPVTVDLAEVVRAALSGIDERVAGAALHVDADLTSAPVHGDPRRLEQIVRNLVLNAVKYSPPGGTVSVQVLCEGDQALLRVTDDGPGIPASDRPHVFERFWRGAQAEGTTGSGIGLAVVDELVRAHGGDVAVTDAPGRGAQLAVRLPQAQAWARTSHPGPRDPSHQVA